MSGRRAPDTIRFNPEQKAAVEKIADDALGVVDRRYGTGYPHFRGGGRALPYHNGHHARAVGEDSAKVAESLGLSHGEVLLAHAAGNAHDIVQLRGIGINEQESAEWLEQEIRKREIFPKAVAKIGALAILGTEPIFTNGVLTDQLANRQRYPSKTAEKLAKSVASADLGELHKPQGPYLAHLIYLESQGKSPNQVPDLRDLVRFQRNQVEMVEGYSYPIRKARRVLATHRAQVIRYAQQVLDQLERGEIVSWNQLLAQDLQFMRRPR